MSRQSPSSAGWAAPWSLILGLVAVAIAVVIMNVPSAALPGELLLVPPLSAIGGLVLARIARGSYPRRSPVLWPGRAVAFIGAFISWSVLVAIIVITVNVAIVLGNNP
jgi:hypothetical protein